MASQSNSTKRSATEVQRQLRDVLRNPDGDWNPDFIKGRVLEVEEKLHLQQFWQRAGRTWLVLGNLLLVALALSPLVVHRNFLDRYALYLGAAALVSVILSPVLVYQQYKRTRATRLAIRQLNYIYRRRLEELDGHIGDSSKDSPLVRQKRYRDDMLDVMAQFREEANKSRRVHNRLQSVVIIGSVLTSAVTTASISYSQFRVTAVVVSAAVGLAAGFMGYFKYHERSFSSQQTADSIEREYEAVVLRVGKYAHKG